MSRPNAKSNGILVWIILYFPICWFAAALAGKWIDGASLIDAMAMFQQIMDNPLDITINEYTLKFVLIFSAIYILAVLYIKMTTVNTRHGEEHGSAKWGNVNKSSRKYKQNPKTDRILSANFRIGLNTRKHRRNNNTLVIGAPGSGKTRFYAKPNILQCNTSFVVTDPKGEALRSTGRMLLENGYKLRVIDLIDFSKSDGYNPFVYIRDDKDVLKLINTIIVNTTPKDASKNDPFWERSETAFLQALMFYLWYRAPKEEQNLGTLIDMLEYATVDEGQRNQVTPLDLLFEALEYEEPEHIAVKQYKIYKQAAAKTAKTINVTVGTRLSSFNIEQIRNITSTDDMNISSVGEKKTAIFAVISDSDSTFNYIIGMLYSQLFSELYYQADRVHFGELPVPVQFILDEFANVALPDEFEKVLATMRSRGISASIIVQSIAQLKSMYRNQDQWQSIAGNCDTLLCLGANDAVSCEYISRKLGKETIQAQSYGRSRGRNGTFTTNKQQIGRELLTPTEVEELDDRLCLIKVRSENPLVDRKYDIMKHRNLVYTVDYNKKRGEDYEEFGKPYIHNAFNIQMLPFDEEQFNAGRLY